MKRRANAPTEEHLFKAAELRAGSAKWEVVAEAVHRSAEAVRRWPMRYAERWREALLRAELRHAVDIDSESVLILRVLARSSPDEKVRLQASKALSHRRVALGRLEVLLRKNPQASPALDPATAIARYLEEYPDEQLAELDREGAELRQRDPRSETSTPTGAT